MAKPKVGTVVDFGMCSRMELRYEELPHVSGTNSWVFYQNGECLDVAVDAKAVQDVAREITLAERGI